MQHSLVDNHVDPQIMHHRSLRLHYIHIAESNELVSSIQYDASDWKKVKFFRNHDQESRNLKESEDGDFRVFELSNCSLQQWLIEIQIGSPKLQTFVVAIDTGSSMLMVPSVRCNDSCEEFPWFNFYDSSQSKTYTPFSIEENSEFHENGVSPNRFSIRGKCMITDQYAHYSLFFQYLNCL